MKTRFLFAVLLVSCCSAAFAAAPLRREIPVRQHGKESGMLLDLTKISLGTLNDVEEKKQYLSTVQLEKQRIQNYTLRMVYENAYTLYKRGDYQRAQELAQTILSIDPNFTQAQTLAKQASHMGTYGTISESEVIEAKFHEASRLYDSGRLVEAQDKLDEILTIRPGNSRALEWKRRIDYEIGREYYRRGDEAYAQKDYQSALDNWYNALMIRKDDQRLVNKISETENMLRKQQVQDSMQEALNFYNQGQYVEAYYIFERITKIQPGDQRVQKYMVQLKDEIASSYYTAGNKAYNQAKYDSAVTYWTNAKKWGANAAEMDLLIKRARNAKEDSLRRKQQAVVEAAKKPQQTEETAKTDASGKTPSSANASSSDPEVPADEEPETVDKMLPGSVSSSVNGQNTTDINETLPTIGGVAGRVSEEAREASRKKYLEGVNAYNNDDFERAREAFIAAKQLDPGNTNAEIGLRRVEELLQGR